MSVTYYFDEEPDVNDNIMGGWVGKYTTGHINYRGTRVWLRSPYTLSFDSGVILEEMLRVKRSIDKGQACPGDAINIRAECLQDIIDVLKKEPESYLSSVFGWFSQSNDEPEIYYKWSNLTLDDLVGKYFFKNRDFIKQENIKGGGHILIDFDPTERFWIIYEKEKIIQELKEVLEKCEEENVAWVWV